MGEHREGAHAPRQRHNIAGIGYSGEEGSLSALRKKGKVRGPGMSGSGLLDEPTQPAIPVLTPSEDPEFKPETVQPLPRVTARIESITPGKKGERLILIADGVGMTHIGRVYGLKKDRVVRSSPAETRDSGVKLQTGLKQIFFAVKGQVTMENGVPWQHGFVLRNNGKGVPPTFLTEGYIRKWDLQANNKRPD